MEIKSIDIEFKKDLQEREYATVTVNNDYVINNKGKLDINKENIGSFYPKADKDGIERSILYRVSLLMGLLKQDKIEFEI